MTNAGSGDFTLPFDMSSTVKEVDKQAKAAESASRGMTNLEQHIRILTSAKKRIQLQQFEDILKGAQSVVNPSVRRGQTSQLDPRTGAKSSLFDNPALWGEGNAHLQVIKQFEKDNPDLMTKFSKGVKDSISALTTFRGVLAGGAVGAVVGFGAQATQAYANRGQAVNRTLGSMEIQSGQAERHLGFKSGQTLEVLKGSGNVEGTSAFIDAAINLKTQKQMTVPPDVMAAGFNAIRRGEDPSTVIGWLNGFQWNKIRDSGSKNLSGRARSEMERRIATSRSDIQTMMEAGGGQRAFGSLYDAAKGAFEQNHPILSEVPVLRQGALVGMAAASWLWGRDKVKDFGYEEDVQPTGGANSRSAVPVRQPVYDVQGGGRLHAAADSLDRATQNLRGRPSWRVGNAPSSQ